MSSHRAAFAALVLAACHGQSPAAPAARASGGAEVSPATPPIPEGAPSASVPAVPAIPLVAVADGTSVSAGSVALARAGARTLAFVADADDRAVVTFDVGTRNALASTPLGARPSALLVTRQGRLAVLGADDARVHVLALVDASTPLTAERTIPVPDEPSSAATSADGGTLLVASRWGHALSLVSLIGSEPAAVVDLPRDPAAVLPSDDGRRALVMHAVGSRYSVVDLATRAVHTASLDTVITRPVFFGKMMPMPPQMTEEEPPMANEPPSQAAGALPAQQAQVATQRLPTRKPSLRMERVTLHADQAFVLARTTDGRLLAPEVFVETGPPMPTSGYGGGVSATATPAVAAFSPDGQAGATGGGQVFGSRCLLPRGASLADDGKRLLVVCAGSDELVEISVRSKGLRVHRILRVPKGPSGVAFDPASKQAIVWSAFERVVSTVSFDKEPKVTSRTTVVRRAEAPPDEVLRGRALFHATFDGRVSSDGRACASCHPDGRDDALTWSAPGGARQTPMLFARIAGTAPFGWDGDAKDLAHHLSHTTARLGGSGLTARNVADIEAYLGWLRPPTAPEYDDGRASLVARGREVFNASSAECSTCHAGDPLTDGDTHDVASRGKGDRLKAFDTPSLRFVARSAPYFHDGRYASLDALVAGVDGTMGHTAQLSPDDRAALLAYLETL